MPAIAVEDLQQQIEQRERELYELRQKLELQQNQLSELTHRKQELQSQLQHVEEEIAALMATAPSPKQRPASAVPAVAPASARSASANGQLMLGEFIMEVLQDQGGAMTGRQLYEEAQRRGYRLTSKDPIKALESRLQKLKSRGIVQRSTSQPGYVLAPTAHRTDRPKSDSKPPVSSSTNKGITTLAQPGLTAKKGRKQLSSASGTGQPSQRKSLPKEQAPLRDVLYHLLKSSRKPLSVQELAERALATGYQSQSTKFVDVVRLRVAQIANVRYLPEKGYLLERS